MKMIIRTLRVAMIALLVSSPVALADDTDIYLGLTSEDGGKPLIMLTLDLRPSVGASVCTTASSASCKEDLGDLAHGALDLVTVDEMGVLVPGGGPDGFQDAQQFSTEDLKNTAWDSEVDKVRLFDVIRAAFQVIFSQDKYKNGTVELGLMLMHDDTCTGSNASGPSEIPDPPNGNQAPDDGCSNGAYILNGFFDPSDPDALQKFYNRLAAIPSPDGDNSGGYTHPYQLRELYLEFYRYILGQPMHNGWLGYADFGSPSSDQDSKLEFNLMDADNEDYTGKQTLRAAPDPNTFPTYVPGTSDPKLIEYQSPFDRDDEWACSALYLINTVFGVSNAEADSDDEIGLDPPLGLKLNRPTDEEVIKALYDTDLAQEGLGVPVDGNQNVTSYFIAKTTNKTQDDWAFAGSNNVQPALSLGDPDKIVANIDDLIGGIISKSSSLVSASVPANVFNRAETLDNVFLALFQAEEDPRWPGNIKKLKVVAKPSFGEPDPDTGVRPLEGVTTELQDVNSTRAFDTETGLIDVNALTFWTDPTGEDVTPLGSSCEDGVTPPLDEDDICGKDGRSVERGGAAQQIPGYLMSSCMAAGPGEVNGSCSRTLFTEDPTDPNSIMAFNKDSGTAQKLTSFLVPGGDKDEAADVAEADAIIGWARGLYNRALDGTEIPVTTDNPRRWLMGDAIHSKPLAVNYGDSDGEGSGYSRDNPDIRLFFGSNDGWFRQILNTTSASTNNESGEEVWGFMPLEVMGKQQVLSTNNPATAEDFHPYGVDGQPVVLVIDNNSNGNIETASPELDKVYVYFGLRRGGKAYYALDVSDPDAEPSLLWKIDNTMSDFSQLGLTFSTPRVAKVRYENTAKDVLIFAGGYHGGWNDAGSSRIGKDLGDSDDSSGTLTGSPVGTAIYVVDAVTGDLIWKAEHAGSTGKVSASVFGHAGLDHSIPSDVAILDTDQNGITDRVYVGDTGGTVWRIDLTELGKDPDTDGCDADSRNCWTASVLAELSDTNASGDRRFFHAPDVVLARDTVNTAETGDPIYAKRRYNGVIIPSGDRAAPKGTVVDNFLYFIKDDINLTGADEALTRTTFKHAGNIAAKGLTDITPCPVGNESACGFDTFDGKIEALSNGWKFALEENGEKGLSTPITVQGTVFATTYLPEGGADAGICAPKLGTGRLYALSVTDGTPPFELSGDITAGPGANRSLELGEGIPPEPPFLVPPPYVCQGDECGEGNDGKVVYPSEGALLRPDGSVFQINGRFQWKSYWNEVGVDPK